MGSLKQLNNYICEVRDKPFEWGKHDCFIFSNSAFKAYHGYGYADEWVGKYLKDGKPMLPSQLKAEFGVNDFEEAIATKLQEISYVPPRGALVATKRAERWHIGYALGVSVGMKAAFLSQKGVIYLPFDDVVKAWVPR
jgi:hypothetical protein